MKLLYIAGQFSGATPERIALNIDAARHAGCQAVERGWFPIIPHANTAKFDLFMPNVPIDFWYEGDIMLMQKCDAVLFIQGWENSSGAQKEYVKAEEFGMKIYHQTQELPQL